MRDKDQRTRVALGVCVRELEQASKELVELLGNLPDNHPLFSTISNHPEIGPAWQRCREKLKNKSDASRRWSESLGKGPW